MATEPHGPAFLAWMARILGRVGPDDLTDGRHYEISAGMLPFAMPSALRLAADLRKTSGHAVSSRLIRSAWMHQFGPQQPMTIVTGEEKQPLLHICDEYQCSDHSVFAQIIARARFGDAYVEGSPSGPWHVLEVGRDGNTRALCSIVLDKEASNQLTLSYETRARADRLRPAIEALVGKVLIFKKRTTQDPIKEIQKAIKQGGKDLPTSSFDPRIPLEIRTQLMQDMYASTYQDWADKPLPALDGLSPRAMLTRPSGEARVRDILALYEGNERRMADADQRAPASLAFLYEQLGIDASPISDAATPTTSSAHHPGDFEVNEAWVVFRILDVPAQLVEGSYYPLGLMDAASTCILNQIMLPAHKAIGEAEARQLLTKLHVAAPRFARELLVPSYLVSPELVKEAGRHRMSIRSVHEDDLAPIVGRAVANFAAHFEQLLKDRASR